ncbi:hypothetical protein Tco_1267568 [Tanacetum coccineum]
MQGTSIRKQEKHLRLMNKFDKFVAGDGKSLTSVYERFSTLINIMDRNQVKPFEISINTKLLNSLQPEWSKYVTLTRQKYILEKERYDILYDYLRQFEPHVKASKAKKVSKNHDPLALVANSYANPPYSHASSSYSRSTKPYYVTHPSSMIDYEDDYQGEIQGDPPEDKLSTAMMLLVRSIIQYYSTPINNRLHTSSNTRNHVVIKDGRVDIPSKNVGYDGNGHYARDYPKPRVRDAKYFREQMLLVAKDEVGVNLDVEENDSMLMNAYGDDQLEELNASVIMMARIQPTDDKSDSHEKLKIVNHTSANDQIDSDIIFDDLYVENNSRQDEHDSNANDQPYANIESLIYNV